MPGEYPKSWPAIARRVKDRAGWRCQACGAPHGRVPYVLTVDHLDYDKANCRLSNLLALCQRCHLRRQGLSPQPRSKAEALRRLRSRVARERSQLPL